MNRKSTNPERLINELHKTERITIQRISIVKNILCVIRNSYYNSHYKGGFQS
jgi:hypothetical protein